MCIGLNTYQSFFCMPFFPLCILFNNLFLPCHNSLKGHTSLKKKWRYVITTSAFYNSVLSFLECCGEIFCVERISLIEISLIALILSSSPVPRRGTLHILQKGWTLWVVSVTSHTKNSRHWRSARNRRPFLSSFSNIQLFKINPSDFAVTPHISTNKVITEDQNSGVEVN